MSILIFGHGSDMATKGIIPVVGGEMSRADVRSSYMVYEAIKHARPEVVINCAGISNPEVVQESYPGDWRREIEVNLIGSYHVAQAALQWDVQTLIFIASVAGLYGKPNHSGYCASKAGVISLVQSLGMEGHNAYAISPGRVDTKMREKDYPGEDPRTRLEPVDIGMIVRQIIGGMHQPGDNIIIRKVGYERIDIETDKGEPWRSVMRVGEPPLV